MKKKVILFLLVLLIATSAYFTSKITAEKEMKKIHIKLPLNQAMTETSNQQRINEVGMEKFTGRKSKEKLPHSFVEANLSLLDTESPDQKMINGHGVVKIGNDTFPFSIINEPISMYVLPDRSRLLSGGLSGTIHTKAGDSLFVLGIDHNPSNQATFASAFIGELNEESGLGVLRFGEPILTKEIGDFIQQTRSAEHGNNGIGVLSSSLAYAAGETYWFQNVSYTSHIGRVPLSGSGAPGSYQNIGNSTAVLSAASIYSSSANNGFERGRIWSRPNNVKSWMTNNSPYASTPSTIRAVLQFQSVKTEGNLWIRNSEPPQTEVSKITIPGVAYTLAGAVNRWGNIVGNVVSLIDGFTYAAIKVSFPEPNNEKHYVEFYNINGLSGMDLPDQYTYKEADLVSANQYKGASAKWNYTLRRPDIKSYPVKVVGRVMYLAYVPNPYTTSGGYFNYAWSGLAEAPHVINR